ncbi:Elongation factor Tu (Fragment) [Seminavis robusta]|uniref:Elongation factor Tu, chloroplastic n=1 Tax=Seminavis robusta TaxID=568900 RepID=A0A9N8EHV0_9STRA
MSSGEGTANNEQPDHEKILNVNVGVLGHVDSGKTSLVKTLSTMLSTAALDKSKQSRQRGMTLDLGFSCFIQDLPPHLKESFPTKEKLQITLVDCPGHASLIRTIIGGAQIIDMVLLVVDAFKGWQAQTTECLVLALLTSRHIVVALNKVDLFAPEERDDLIEKAKNSVRKRLQGTRFADAPLIGVSACVGGEKVAASDGETSHLQMAHENFNIDKLIDLLRSELPQPKRSSTGPFSFSVDHCFPIRGRGTVLTGTVLNGSASVNEMLEFPALGLERKIKSIQMFKRQVQSIMQGDRAGICVSNLDAKLLERGIAASPGAIQLWKRGIALVRKVSYFPGNLPCGSKFHVSVGHATVMATVTFFGAKELRNVDISQTQEPEQSATVTGSKKAKEPGLQSSSLGGDANIAGLPRIPFDFNQDFVVQEELIDSGKEIDKNSADNRGLLNWAKLEFQIPVFCPPNSLIIGSRLDAVENNSVSSSSCRLAFSGRLIEKMDDTGNDQVKLYTVKEKLGAISRLGDPHRRNDDQRIVRYEVFGTDLFKAETNMKVFVGMKLLTKNGEVGEIKSSFGTTGKFRVLFPAGIEAREGDPLILRFKRFVHDSTKAMHQDVELPVARSGTRLEPPKKGKKKAPPKGVKLDGEIASIKGDVLADGKHNMAIIAGFFAPEVDIRQKVGWKVVIPSTNESGAIAGPFGKAGKCKVTFQDGISAEPGAKAKLIIE